MNILKLPINKRWFDMILAGIKKEEYREIKSYWATRLLAIKEPYNYEESWYDLIFDLDQGNPNALSENFASFKTFDAVEFRNGYQKDSPTMLVECLGIGTGNPKREWGRYLWEKDGELPYCFIIKLGKILLIQNTKP